MAGINADQAIGRIDDDAFGGSRDDDVARLGVKEHVINRGQASQTEHLFGRPSAGSKSCGEGLLQPVDRNLAKLARSHQVVVKILAGGDQSLLSNAWIELADFQHACRINVDPGDRLSEIVDGVAAAALAVDRGIGRETDRDGNTQGGQ